MNAKSTECTALALPMRPLFPLWQPGMIREMGLRWLARQRADKQLADWKSRVSDVYGLLELRP